MPGAMLVRFKPLISKILSHSLLMCISFCLLCINSSCEATEPGDEVMFSRNKILNLVNKARQNGHYCGKKWYPAVTRLSWNESLEKAARQHSEDMFNKNYFSHKGSNGGYVDDRLYAQHYFWTSCGENVAYGMLYEDEVIEEWLNSPGHCANIMNPAYTQMGAWVTGLYWTQVLAKPQS
jgi:uncharacterized protein YkwD